MAMTPGDLIQVEIDSEPVHTTVRNNNRAAISLLGVYEISKLLIAAARIENTLSGVLQLLLSFMEMRHGLIALLKADGSPDMVVGAGWS